MDIAGIIAEVIVQTGRSDKTALITQAAKAMVLKAHSLDFFPRDRVESNILAVSPTAANEVSVTLPARWRRFNYIFQCDSTGRPISGHVGFTRVDAEDVFLFDTRRRNEVYYVVGENVKMLNYNREISHYRWAYFAYPDVSTTNKETWMTKNDMLAQAIIDGTTWYVHKKLEHQTSARIEMENWNEWKGIILAEALTEDV